VHCERHLGFLLILILLHAAILLLLAARFVRQRHSRKNKNRGNASVQRDLAHELPPSWNYRVRPIAGLCRAGAHSKNFLADS